MYISPGLNELIINYYLKYLILETPTTVDLMPSPFQPPSPPPPPIVPLSKRPPPPPPKQMHLVSRRCRAALSACLVVLATDANCIYWDRHTIANSIIPLTLLCTAKFHEWHSQVHVCHHEQCYLFHGTINWNHSYLKKSFRKHINGLVQDCSNSSALAVELLQSCTTS